MDAEDGDRAMLCFEKAVDLAPTNHLFRTSLASIYVKEGNTERALNTLAGGMNNALAHFRLAQMLDKSEQRRDALEHYELAYGQDSEMVLAKHLAHQNRIALGMVAPPMQDSQTRLAQATGKDLRPESNQQANHDAVRKIKTEIRRRPSPAPKGRVIENSYETNPLAESTEISPYTDPGPTNIGSSGEAAPVIRQAERSITAPAPTGNTNARASNQQPVRSTQSPRIPAASQQIWNYTTEDVNAEVNAIAEEKINEVSSSIPRRPLVRPEAVQTSMTQAASTTPTSDSSEAKPSTSVMTTGHAGFSNASRVQKAELTKPVIRMPVIPKMLPESTTVTRPPRIRMNAKYNGNTDPVKQTRVTHNSLNDIFEK